MTNLTTTIAALRNEVAFEGDKAVRAYDKFVRRMTELSETLESNEVFHDAAYEWRRIALNGIKASMPNAIVLSTCIEAIYTHFMKDRDIERFDAAEALENMNMTDDLVPVVEAQNELAAGTLLISEENTITNNEGEINMENLVLAPQTAEEVAASVVEVVETKEEVIEMAVETKVNEEVAVEVNTTEEVKTMKAASFETVNRETEERLIAFGKQLAEAGKVENRSFMKVASQSEIDLNNEYVRLALIEMGLTIKSAELEAAFIASNIKDDLYKVTHNCATVLSVNIPEHKMELVSVGDNQYFRNAKEFFSTEYVKMTIANTIVESDNYCSNMFTVTYAAGNKSVGKTDRFLYKSGSIIARVDSEGVLIDIYTNNIVPAQNTLVFEKFFGLPGTASQSRNLTAVFLKFESFDQIFNIVNKGCQGVLSKFMNKVVKDKDAAKYGVRIMANLTSSVDYATITGFAILAGTFGTASHQLDGMNHIVSSLFGNNPQNRPNADKAYAKSISDKDMPFLIKQYAKEDNFVFFKDIENKAEVDAIYEKGYNGPLKGKVIIFADSIEEVQVFSDLNASKAAFDYTAESKFNVLEVERPMPLNSSKQLLNVITHLPEGRAYVQNKIEEAIKKAFSSDTLKEVLTEKEMSSAFPEMVINAATDARFTNETLNNAFIKAALKKVKSIVNKAKFEMKGEGRRIFGDIAVHFGKQVLREDEAYAKGITGLQTVIRYPKASTGSFLVLKFLTKKELCERIDETFKDKAVRAWLKRNFNSTTKGGMHINSYKGTFQTLGGADMDFDCVFIIKDEDFNKLVVKGGHKITNLTPPAAVESDEYIYNIETMINPLFNTIASTIDSVGVIAKAYEFVTALLTLDKLPLDVAYDAIYFGLAVALKNAQQMAREIVMGPNCMKLAKRIHNEYGFVKEVKNYRNDVNNVRSKYTLFDNSVAVGPKYNFASKYKPQVETTEYKPLPTSGEVKLSEEIILDQIEAFLGLPQTEENFRMFAQDCDSFGSFDMEINIDGTKTGIYTFLKVALNMAYSLYSDVAYEFELNAEGKLVTTHNELKAHKVYFKDCLANIREAVIPVIEACVEETAALCKADPDAYNKEYVALTEPQRAAAGTLRGIYSAVAGASEEVISNEGRKAFYDAIGNTFAATMGYEGVKLGKVASFVAQSRFTKDYATRTTLVEQADKANAFNFKCLPQETAMKFIEAEGKNGCIHGDKVEMTTIISGKVTFNKGVAVDENGSIIALAPGATGEREIKYINGAFYAVAEYKFTRTPNRYVIEVKDNVAVGGQAYKLKRFNEFNDAYMNQIKQSKLAQAFDGQDLDEDEREYLASTMEVEGGKNVLFFAQFAAEQGYKFNVSASNGNFTFATTVGKSTITFGHCANGEMMRKFDGQIVEIENAIQVGKKVYLVVSFASATKEDMLAQATSDENVETKLDKVVLYVNKEEKSVKNKVYKKKHYVVCSNVNEQYTLAEKPVVVEWKRESLQ